MPSGIKLKNAQDQECFINHPDNAGAININSNNIVTKSVTSVSDNAIARYDGTTGKVQNSGVVIDDGGKVGIGGTPNTRLDIKGPYSNDGNQATYVGTIQINEGGITSLNQVGGLELKCSVFGAGYGAKILGIDNGTILFGTRHSNVLFTERLRIDSNSGNVLVTGTGGLGYGTGSGGTVTQLISKSTNVILNKHNGKVIMNNAPLAAGASVAFQIGNNLLTETDNIYITYSGSYNTSYDISAGNVESGASIVLKNKTAETLSDPVSFCFAIIKGAVS